MSFFDFMIGGTVSTTLHKAFMTSTILPLKPHHSRDLPASNWARVTGSAHAVQTPQMAVLSLLASPSTTRSAALQHLHRKERVSEQGVFEIHAVFHKHTFDEHICTRFRGKQCEVGVSTVDSREALDKPLILLEPQSRP